MTEPTLSPSTRSAASGTEAGADPGPLVSVAWLAEHLADPDPRLVRTSSLPERYPQGHIPVESFVNDDNTFRSPAEIRALVDAAVREAGGEDATSLRAACRQGGVRAAAAWFALSVLADVPIANDARSWEEWGNRIDPPIEV